MPVGRISPRARAYVRRQATAVMEATCRIERVQKATFNDADLVATAGSREVIYEGTCRLWESRGQGIVQIGDDNVVMQSTNLSIPWDADCDPRRDDEFVILGHHTDSRVVGKRGVILDAPKAGDLRATKTFSVQMQQPKGDHG